MNILCDSVKQMNLNFPWFIYPGAPFTGYISEMHLPELLRLEMYLDSLGLTSTPVLFHLTIGSPMEEVGVQTLREHKCMFQLYQLVPDHILRAAKNGITVVNYVVCPNTVDSPMFMASGEFIKTCKNKYKHTTYPITIYFFTTMMPTKDKHRNAKYMEHFAKNDFENMIPRGVKMYKQTPSDRSYVDQFYGVLRRTVDSIGHRGGFSSCFSFAVFNDDTPNYKFNQCVMFKEILDCYPESPSSCIFEWIFRYDHYMVHNMHDIVPQSPYPRTLVFVPPDMLGEEKPRPICYMELIFDDFGNVKYHDGGLDCCDSVIQSDGIEHKSCDIDPVSLPHTCETDSEECGSWSKHTLCNKIQTSTDAVYHISIRKSQTEDDSDKNTCYHESY